ncbi:protein translocase subunit SecDF [Sediminitomix flava]|uniref:Multifunctional fusion protein n=1 Tax=Sediminitomix flava TaxID=379075 RepID=A0A315ZD78_SEDFL|nr:protein translocase subunit SecDF [Sediminitomix flava]PWJ42808.1 SecD/SecF fusion protein [Sediminitomix flava]
MRNKGGINFIAIVLAVLCAFYLSFTYVSNSIESEADEFARNEKGQVDYQKKQFYLDSISNEPRLFGYTNGEVQEMKIALGLDLQGGMHVTLQVNPAEMLKAYAGPNASDPRFGKALVAAQAGLANSQATFTDLFFDALEEEANGEPFANFFANATNRDRINFNSSNQEVKDVVRGEVDGAVGRAEEVIRNRIDRFGVVSPNIQRVQGTDRIQLELPGVSNPERVRKLLSGVAKLEFLEVYNAQEVSPMLAKANEYWMANMAPKSDDAAEPEAKEEKAEDSSLFEGAEGDSATAEADTAAVAPEQQLSPIFAKMLPTPYGAMLFATADTAEVNAFLVDKQIASLLPRDMKFLWSNKPNMSQGGKDFFELVPVKKGMKGAPLTGEYVADAFASRDQMGRPAVSMSMNPEGGRIWKKLTGANLGRRVAIVLDNLVYTAPTVQSEIGEGRSEITGNFTLEETNDLANVLKAGKLPAPTQIVEEVVVGPTLGKEAQAQGLISILVGLAAVIVFMLIYYANAGLIANAALLLNVFFIFGVLASMGAALTLPGIAGIVLTFGMSVDANVLIFERIREEKAKGAGLLKAIELGYGKAFWSIFDANITTLLTAIFLVIFGSGPIKGFATTLIIGILCSFFTAVFVSRVLVHMWTKKNGDASNFKISIVKEIKKYDIDFIGKRKIAYVGSLILIVVGMGLTFMNGLNLGVDFQGGRSYIVAFEEGNNVVASDYKVAVSKELSQGAEDAVSVDAKTYGNNHTLKITTNYLVDETSEDADTKSLNAIATAIEKISGKKYEKGDQIIEGTFVIPSTSKVGAVIADDMKASAIEATLFALAAIFLYITLRFGQWRFGMGAWAALVHDVLVVFSIFAIADVLGFAFEIDQVFVAALLTVVGYSINDTVVVFDRIREEFSLDTTSPVSKVMNAALNSTLNRTLVTSFTTLLVVLILFFFGGEVLRGFSFALIVGIIAGTYSSLFIASPIVYSTTDHDKLREEEQTDDAEVQA